MARSKSWDVPPSLFANVVEEDLTKRIRVIAMAMLNEIVLRSPVDTGRFRGNNVVTVGNPVLIGTEIVDKAGSDTITNGLRAMTGLEPYTVVYIQNNLVYAEKLENGSSKQAPAGIYGVSFRGVAEAYKR